MAMNCAERKVKGGIESAYDDRVMTIGRVTVLTELKGDRTACHYCGPCPRGCSTGSYFSSLSAALPAARSGIVSWPTPFKQGPRARCRACDCTVREMQHGNL